MGDDEKKRTDKMYLTKHDVVVCLSDDDEMNTNIPSGEMERGPANIAS